jgi:two-component system chemotaxis sensor kinase CheA
LALRVQAVLGQVQVLLKPLGDFFGSANGISGAAILGDGKVALVLDPDGMQAELEKKRSANSETNK